MVCVAVVASVQIVDTMEARVSCSGVQVWAIHHQRVVLAWLGVSMRIPERVGGRGGSSTLVGVWESRD